MFVFHHYDDNYTNNLVERELNEVTFYLQNEYFSKRMYNPEFRILSALPTGASLYTQYDLTASAIANIEARLDNLKLIFERTLDNQTENTQRVKAMFMQLRQQYQAASSGTQVKDDEIRKLQQDLETANNDLKKLNSLRQDLVAANNEVTRLQNEIDDWKRRGSLISSAQQQLAMTELALAKEKTLSADLLARVSVLEDEVKALAKAKDDMEAALRKTIQDNIDEISQLTMQLNGTTSMTANTTQRLENEIKRLEKELADAKAEISQLKAELQSLAANNPAVAQLQQQLATLDAQFKKAQQELSDAHAKLSATNQTITAYSADLKKCQDELVKSNNALAQLQKQIGSTKSTAVADLQEALAKAKSDAANAQNNLNQLQKKHDNLKLDYRKAVEDFDKRNRQSQKLIQDLEEQIHQQADTIKQLTAAAAAQNSNELAALQARYDQLEMDYNDAMAKMQHFPEIEKNNILLTAENKALENKIKHYKTLYSDCYKRIDAEDTRNKILIETIKSMEVDLIREQSNPFFVDNIPFFESVDLVHNVDQWISSDLINYVAAVPEFVLKRKLTVPGNIMLQMLESTRTKSKEINDKLDQLHRITYKRKIGHIPKPTKENDLAITVKYYEDDIKRFKHLISDDRTLKSHATTLEEIYRILVQQRTYMISLLDKKQTDYLEVISDRDKYIAKYNALLVDVQAQASGLARRTVGDLQVQLNQERQLTTDLTNKLQKLEVELIALRSDNLAKDRALVDLEQDIIRKSNMGFSEKLDRLIAVAGNVVKSRIPYKDALQYLLDIDNLVFQVEQTANNLVQMYNFDKNDLRSIQSQTMLNKQTLQYAYGLVPGVPGPGAAP